MSKRRKRKLQGTQDGWVYVLDIGYDRLYKIGMSQHLNSRVRALSKANPKLRIEMAYLVLNVKNVEARLHEKYTDEHYKWELFTLQPHNLKSIKRLLVEENNNFLRSRKLQRQARLRSQEGKTYAKAET